MSVLSLQLPLHNTTVTAPSHHYGMARRVWCAPMMTPSGRSL